MITSFFQNTSVFAEKSDTEIIENISSKIEYEILEKREEKSKYFKLNDGQIIKVEYPIAVHKFNNLGQWEEIHFKNNFVNFPNDENFVSISGGKYDITWKFNDLEKTIIQENENKRIYKNVYKDIDLEYETKDRKLTENLILNSKTDKNEFEIEYFIKDLNVKKVNDKKINLLDKDGNLVYTISAPKMFDGNGENSENI